MSAVFKNRIALFYRGFMMVFLGGVALITWIAFRDGKPEEGLGWLPFIVLPFWLAGLFGCWWAFRQETVKAEVVGLGKLVLTRSRAFRSTRLELRSNMISQIAVVEGTDSEGDPYFRCVLFVSGVDEVTFSEGHRREKVEDDVARLRAALGI